MNSLQLLRLDLSDSLAPGNKSYKLAMNFEHARSLGLKRIVSFGGVWSNHLHALAAAGLKEGFETVGIVRGGYSETPTPMLRDASAWGMQLVDVSRQEYRRRHDPDYLRDLEQQFAPCWVIPEGGANELGMAGCRAIVDCLPTAQIDRLTVVLPVGTGTTLAGVVAGLPSSSAVWGISVLKGAKDLDQQVATMLDSFAPGGHSKWRIFHQYHGGGYARVSPELQAFVLAFERVHQIPLDPVYTGKALFAVHAMIGAGQMPESAVFIHTGGLQGRRGYSWLI